MSTTTTGDRIAVEGLDLLCSGRDVNSEAWGAAPLGELLRFQNGVNAEKSAYGSGIRFANVLEVINHSHLWATDIPGRVSLPVDVMKRYQLQSGDVLFNRTSETQEEVGLASVYSDNESVVFGGFVIRGRRTSARMDPVFSGYVLRSHPVRAQIIAKGQGAIRANIGQGDLKQVVVPIPSLSEQRAVAAVLSDVDALISCLDKVIGKKLAIKLAVMQLLLTGRVRLPGFGKHAGSRPSARDSVLRDWKVISLGSLGAWRGGLTPSLADPKNWEGGDIPWISSSDVRGQELSSTAAFITRRATQATAVPRLPGDSIVVVMRSGILRRFLPVVLITREMAINQDVKGLPPNSSFDPRFVQQMIAFRQEDILATCMKSGTTVESIDAGWFKAFEIAMPRVDEQKAIAKVLSDMDSEIAILDRRRAKTNAIKQSMMQQLLTGRIRLFQSEVVA